MLLLDDDLSHERDFLLDSLNKKGIMVRPAWNLMHELGIYKHCPKMENLSAAENLSKRLVNIPSSPSLVLNKIKNRPDLTNFE